MFKNLIHFFSYFFDFMLGIWLYTGFLKILINSKKEYVYIFLIIFLTILSVFLPLSGLYSYRKFKFAEYKDHKIEFRSVQNRLIFQPIFWLIVILFGLFSNFLIDADPWIIFSVIGGIHIFLYKIFKEKVKNPFYILLLGLFYFLIFILNDLLVYLRIVNSPLESINIYLTRTFEFPAVGVMLWVFIILFILSFRK